MAAFSAAVEEIRLLSEEEMRIGDDRSKAETTKDVDDGGEGEDDDQEFEDHVKLHQRLSRNLYYGQLALPSSYKLSLPVTEICVEQFNRRGVRDAIEVKLDRLNMTKAAKVAHDTCTSPTSLVLALLYLERLRGSNPSYLGSVSSTDLFLISLMVASKYLHDDGEEDEVFNDEWAASGGMDKKDLNRLEMEFLTSIDWRVHVTQAEFETATRRLETAVVVRQLSVRRWNGLTYSDMAVLLARRVAAAAELAMAVKVTAVIVAAYATGLATMLGTCHILNCVKLGPSAVSQSVSTIATSFGSRSTPSPPEKHPPASPDLSSTGNEQHDFLQLCIDLANSTDREAAVKNCKVMARNCNSPILTFADGSGALAHHQTLPIVYAEGGGGGLGEQLPLIHRSEAFLGVSASIFY